MDPNRFWSKVECLGPDDCWQWRGYRLSRGYGIWGRHTLAHRQAWALTHGPIAPGLCVLHRCDNPPCVNPAHLFVGTQVDNLQDMHAKGRYINGNTIKTECPSGHPYSAENTLVTAGRRICRICKRRRETARRQQEAMS